MLPIQISHLQKICINDIIYKYVQQLLLNDDSYIVETQEHKNNVKNDLIEAILRALVEVEL